MAPRNTLKTLQKKKSSQMRRSICDRDGHFDSICSQTETLKQQVQAAAARGKAQAHKYSTSNVTHIVIWARFASDKPNLCASGHARSCPSLDQGHAPTSNARRYDQTMQQVGQNRFTQLIHILHAGTKRWWPQIHDEGGGGGRVHGVY